jgi:multiple sugar transport system permease protein
MRQKRRVMLWGYFFIGPAILGVLLFQLFPMTFSLIVSFMKWDMVRPAEWIGLENYKGLFHDPLFRTSLRVTLTYALIEVPLVTFCALFTAILLNQKVKGLSFMRTAFYLPSLVPIVANAAIWMYLFNPMFGLFSRLLVTLHLPPSNWIYDSRWVLFCIAIMSVWTAGNTVIIYLAGLQGIPRELYEAAYLDGSRAFHTFRRITLPLLSPVLFFTIVMGIIGSLQTFSQAFIMTSGGPSNHSLFYVYNLYRTAFTNSQMGYASAMAWIMFIFIGFITLVLFKTRKRWVYNEEV